MSEVAIQTKESQYTVPNAQPPAWLTTANVMGLINPDVLESIERYDPRGLSDVRKSSMLEAARSALTDFGAPEGTEKSLLAITESVATGVRADEDVEVAVKNAVQFCLSIDPAAKNMGRYSVHFGLIARNDATWKALPAFARIIAPSHDTDESTNSEPQANSNDVFTLAALLSAARGFDTEGQTELFATCINRNRTGKSWRQELEMSINWADADMFDVIDTISEAAGKIENLEVREKAIDAAQAYMFNHRLDKESADAYINTVLPRMVENDLALLAVLESHGSSDIRAKGYGRILRYRPEDFVLGALVSPVEPIKIRELMDALKDIPTSDRHRIEQNRLDALRIPGPAGDELHQLVHDDKPGAHEAISAVAHYGRTGDFDEFKAQIDRLRQIHGGKYRTNWQALFDGVIDGETFVFSSIRPGRAVVARSRPDAIATEGVTGREESLQTILDRLERNTLSISDDPPSVSDERLAALLDELRDSAQNRSALGETTKYINDSLQEMMEARKVGLEPSFVEAVAWLERRQFDYLKAITFEDQIGLHKTSLFGEILRTHELTHNRLFAKEELDGFMDGLSKLTDRDAAKAVFDRIMKQIGDIGEEYVSHGRKDWADGLWSGNVTHELIGLTDERHAETAVGRRVQAQRKMAGSAALLGLLKR
ncbi:hypothetical protein KA016_01725 [Candidatus Saccharibacteria bacterium]|jgi:hypothetical protein|nr:hypothetical protein [Candidatus Saccharibacteria bacterium]